MNVKIRFDSNEPIYKQIGNFVKEGIANGKLKEGDKLPTVRELAAELDLAKGTVKHAYDDLLKQGIIDMRQGRGTFIAGGSERSQASRKEQAMQIIDEALDELQDLSFSARDIDIFFKLKLGEREFEEAVLKVAVVDCNEEALNSISRQIERQADVEIYKILLADLLKNPYSIGEEVDAVVTTKTHLSQIEKFVTDKEKIIPVVLTPASRTIIEIAKVSEKENLCVASSSYKFFEIVENSCRRINLYGKPMKNLIFGNEEELKQALVHADAVIVPPDFRTYCGGEEEKAVREFSQSKPVIVYEYQMDEGSIMYLSKKLHEISLNNKNPKGM